MDTVVALEGRILGKPASADEAASMLRALSGRRHEVFTGVAVLFGNEMHQEVVRTAVRFKALSEPEIRAYLRTGESLDKAGAYGIQGLAALFVEEIRGCYYNVVGFPLNRVYEILRGLGFEPKSFGGGKRDAAGG